MERGDWVVLDNANLCSATVLDRLNPLFEPHGTVSRVGVEFLLTLVVRCPNGE